MSLYADYIKEREGYETVEDGTFFVTYLELEDALYIRDIYIAPEYRNKMKSIEIGEMTIGLAKEKGLKALIGSVDTTTNGWRRNKEIMEKFGYKEVYQDGNVIYFNKELV